MLQKHGLVSLYSKFVEAGVDEEILWELDDEFLNEAGLTAVQKLKYRRAKERLYGAGRIDLSLPLKEGGNYYRTNPIFVISACENIFISKIRARL